MEHSSSDLLCVSGQSDVNLFTASPSRSLLPPQQPQQVHRHASRSRVLRPTVGGSSPAGGGGLSLPPISHSIPSMRRFSCTSIDLQSDCTEVVYVPPRVFAGDSMGKPTSTTVITDISRTANRVLSHATRALQLQDHYSRLTDSRNSDLSSTDGTVTTMSSSVFASGAGVAQSARSVSVKKSLDRISRMFADHGKPPKPKSVTARGGAAGTGGGGVSAGDGRDTRDGALSIESSASFPPRPPPKQGSGQQQQQQSPDKQQRRNTVVSSSSPTALDRSGAKIKDGNNNKNTPTTPGGGGGGAGNDEHFVKATKALLAAGGPDYIQNVKHETMERQARNKEELQELWHGLAEAMSITRGVPVAMNLGDLKGQDALKKRSPDADRIGDAGGGGGGVGGGGGAATTKKGVGVGVGVGDSPGREADAGNNNNNNSNNNNSPAAVASKDLKMFTRATTNDALAGALDKNSIEGRLAAALLAARPGGTDSVSQKRSARFTSHFLSDQIIGSTGGQQARREIREKMRTTREALLRDEPKNRAKLVKGYLKQVRLNNDRVQELKTLGRKWSTLTAGMLTSASAAGIDDVEVPTEREELIEDPTSTAFITGMGEIDFKKQSLAVMGPSMRDLAKARAKEAREKKMGNINQSNNNNGSGNNNNTNNNKDGGDMSRCDDDDDSDTSSVRERKKEEEDTMAAIQAGMQLPRGAPVFLTMLPRSVAGGLNVTQFISTASHERALLRQQHRAEDRALKGEARVKELKATVKLPTRNSSAEVRRVRAKKHEMMMERVGLFTERMEKREASATASGANAATVAKQFSVWIALVVRAQRWANAIAAKWPPFEEEKRKYAVFHPPYTEQRLKDLGAASQIIQRHMFRFRVRQYFIQRRTAAFVVLAAMRHVVRHMRWRWAVHQFMARVELVKKTIQSRLRRRHGRRILWFHQWRKAEPDVLRLTNLYRDSDVRNFVGPQAVARLRELHMPITNSSAADRGLLPLWNKLREVYRLETTYGAPLIKAAVQLMEFVQKSAAEGASPGRLVPTPSERIEKAMADLYNLRADQLRRDMHTFIKDKRTDAMLQRALKSHEYQSSSNASSNANIMSGGAGTKNNNHNNASSASSHALKNDNFSYSRPRIQITTAELPNLPLFLSYEEIVHQIVERQQDACLLNRQESAARADGATGMPPAEPSSSSGVLFNEPEDDYNVSDEAPKQSQLQRGAAGTRNASGFLPGASFRMKRRMSVNTNLLEVPTQSASLGARRASMVVNLNGNLLDIANNNNNNNNNNNSPSARNPSFRERTRSFNTAGTESSSQQPPLRSPQRSHSIFRMSMSQNGSLG